MSMIRNNPNFTPDSVIDDFRAKTRREFLFKEGEKDLDGLRGSKPLLNGVRFEPSKQWNRKRQYTAKSCVGPTTYDTRPYEVLGLAKRQGRKCERHMRF